MLILKIDCEFDSKKSDFLKMRLVKFLNRNVT